MKPLLKGVFIGCVVCALNASATPPVITSQPQSLTINIASTATFSVTADNASAYQWMFGAQAIGGATNSTLTLEDVSASQAGAYSVVVSSADASTNSQPAHLTLVAGTIVQMTFSGYASGGPSNVTLQLFDHDKPATVQNFLHYIVSGAYSNLFWTRLVPGFVLQGGDYTTNERTNGPPPAVNSVENNYTFNLGYNPPFPFQIDNEFDVGPLIHNTFGTIAMAKSPGNPDSAVNTFFFNLADNSTNLDNQNGGFTVFGRILSGTNVLDYFNTFSSATIFDRADPSGAPTNGIYNSGQSPFTALPMNYHGITEPGNSNFYYVDFNLPTPVLDTNPPAIAVVSPGNGATVTNADVIVTGTAADDVGLARVSCSVSSPTFNGGFPVQANVIGTTNWHFDFGSLPPGTYSIYASSQDGAGNLSSPTQPTFVVPQFPCYVNVSGSGTLSRDINPTNVNIGSNYVIKATAKPGWTFVNWTRGTNVSINPVDSFTMFNGLELTANFIQNTLPGGISFTYPSANAKVGATSVALTGKVAASAGVTTITARIFAKSTGGSVTDAMVTSSAAAWSLPAVQLQPGDYTVQALASNAIGRTTVIAENFTVLSALSVAIEGPGTTSISNGAYLQLGAKYSVRAVPARGALFYAWSGPSGFSLNPALTFTEAEGTALEATFLSNGLANQVAFTSPAPNSEVRTNNILVTGTVSSSVSSPQIICQLFLGGAPATTLETATVTGSTWSVLFPQLKQGAYTAVAIASDSDENQTLVSESFKLNFFPNVAGTYYGVFSTTPVVATDAGLIKLTLSPSGFISGKMQLPFFTYLLPPYPLNSLGQAFLQGQGLNGYPIYFVFQFDLTNGLYEVVGNIYSLGSVAPLTGYRAVTQLPTNTLAGKFVLDLETITNQSSIGPTNDGFATLTVGQTGALSLGGVLSDNTPFSEGVGVSKDGVWPVYATLYGGHGVVIGWETNVIGSDGAAGSVGNLIWLKPAVRDTYFTNGFTITAALSGTNYLAPVAGTQYQVVFAGGSINPALSNSLTVNNSGQFVPESGAPDKLTISLSSAGAITGKIFNPADNQTFQIHGAFTSPTAGGSGFILDSDGQSEPFQITRVP